MAEVRLLIVGTEQYKVWAEEYKVWESIDSAASMATVREAFEPFQVRTEAALDKNGTTVAVTAPDARKALDGWFRRSAIDNSSEGGPINTILYVVGHGVIDDSELFVMTHESPKDSELGSAALEVNEVARRLKDWVRIIDDDRGWTVVILDCCLAGVGVVQIVNSLTHRGTAMWRRDVGVLGSAGKDASFAGRLPEALNSVLSNLQPTDTYIGVRELFEGVGKRLGAVEELANVGFIPLAARLEYPRGARGVSGQVDSMELLDGVIAKLIETDPEVIAHFLNKAQGTEIDERAWFFEGRGVDTRNLVRWLGDTPQGMYVVTGDPGTGKSAMLGRIVTFAEPELLAALVEADVIRQPRETLVASRPFDAVIHLTSKTFSDTVARLKDVLGLGTNAVEAMSEADSVIEHLRARTEPFTLVVDALDEALEPFPIAASLLRRLAAIDGVKVVVGTRRSLNEGPDKAKADDTHLINALGLRIDDRTERSFVRELENEVDAVQRYSLNRLARGFEPQRAALIADQIADRGQPFLFARLATTELLAQPDLDDDAVTHLLAGEHADIFRSALARFEATDPHIVPLLRTLAYGLGRGFPERWGIWKEVTEAFHPGLEIDQEDIEKTLSTAGAYIIRDGERGYTAYRLAHRTFAEHFDDET